MKFCYLKGLDGRREVLLFWFGADVLYVEM